MSVTLDSFRNVLHADGPARDRSAAMMLYGQFIGAWQGRLIFLDRDGARRETSAEVHFGWVLAGRAVQDVWIAPSRAARGNGERLLMHGTTVRVYDPTQDLWHITWIDPVKQVCNRMTGRQIGDDIVQEYRTEEGARCQWRFTDITPDSFHWISRTSNDEGATWAVQGEFFLRRAEV